MLETFVHKYFFVEEISKKLQNLHNGDFNVEGCIGFQKNKPTLRKIT